MHVEDLSEFRPDRLQGPAVFPPVFVWRQPLTEIAAADHGNRDAAPPKDFVECHPGSSGMVRIGYHQNASDSLFPAMLQSQIGIGERVLRADKNGEATVSQVTFRAIATDDVLPFTSVLPDQNQLGNQVLIVKADGPAQALAITPTAEDHCRLRTHGLGLDHQPLGDGEEKANQGGYKKDA